MRKLVVVEFVTLDGVMQGLGSPDEDRDGGFEHGGWGGAYMDDVQMRAAAEGMTATSAYLLGRRTFEKMAAFWPYQPDDNLMAAHLNATPKYVATRTLREVREVPWGNSHLLNGDLGQDVADLKADGAGNIVVLGSGELVQQLIAEDLVDEYRLFLHPLVLGTGKRLFRATAHPIELRLLEWAATTTGVLMLSYAKA